MGPAGDGPAFALLQALSGYAYSWLFSHTGQNYTLIFACGAVAMAAALALDFGGARRQAAKLPSA